MYGPWVALLMRIFIIYRIRENFLFYLYFSSFLIYSVRYCERFLSISTRLLHKMPINSSYKAEIFVAAPIFQPFILIISLYFANYWALAFTILSFSFSFIRLYLNYSVFVHSFTHSQARRFRLIYTYIAIFRVLNALYLKHNLFQNYLYAICI